MAQLANNFVGGSSNLISGPQSKEETAPLPGRFSLGQPAQSSNIMGILHQSHSVQGEHQSQQPLVPVRYASN